MALFRKPKEVIEEKETPIWACTNEVCHGWMRHSFSFSSSPNCPLCSAEMIQEIRMLPVIEYS